MNILKAFALIGPFVNNGDRAVSPVGELSGRSATFKRDVKLHTAETAPNLTLAVFSYKENNESRPLPKPSANACLEVMQWVYDKARLMVFTEQKVRFQQEFVADLGEVYQLIDSGVMISNESMFVPEYIVFAPYGETSGTEWKIWFSDQSFYNQFDEYEAEVISPLVNLDAFFGSYNDVRLLINQVKVQEITRRIDEAADGDPYTVLRTDIYEWRDPSNPDLRVETEWSMIMYGIAGDNPDAVREVTREWILANSSRTQEEWATIFPEIFMSTEFIITPFFHRYSVPNKAREAGIHSSVVNAAEAIALCQKTCKGTGYNDEYITGAVDILPSLHKSLMLAVVGGPENRDGINHLVARFPDLMNVSSTHIDFGRMSQETRDFIFTLSDMLVIAETLTASSSVPRGYNRVIRDDVIYISTTIDRFLYLVVSKGTVEMLTSEGGGE